MHGLDNYNNTCCTAMRARISFAALDATSLPLLPHLLQERDGEGEGEHEPRRLDEQPRHERLDEQPRHVRLDEQPRHVCHVLHDGVVQWLG